jgi:vitamin B12 transport system substrate-binding protein
MLLHKLTAVSGWLLLSYIAVISLGLKASETATVAKPFDRIIALSPHSVEMLYAMGAGYKIVATVERSDFPKAANLIPRIGNYTGVQLEKIIESKPDLIIAWKGGNKLADLNKLESLGFNIIYSDPKSFTEVADDLLKIGKLVGFEKQAQVAADQLTQRHNKIVNNYNDKASVDVFYQLWDDPLRTVGPSSWVANLIKDCHGNNIFDDTSAAYPLVSVESVIGKNPDVMIVQHHSKKDNAKKELWHKWNIIKAVKNKQIHHINPDIMLRPTPRALDGLDKLCEAIDSAR